MSCPTPGCIAFGAHRLSECYNKADADLYYTRCFGNMPPDRSSADVLREDAMRTGRPERYLKYRPVQIGEVR